MAVSARINTEETHNIMHEFSKFVNQEGHKTLDERKFADREFGKRLDALNMDASLLGSWTGGEDAFYTVGYTI